ncbi:MAG: hypothetical protein R3C61_17170 [Bacteroidia bacterium]
MKNLYFLLLMIAGIDAVGQSLQIEIFASGGSNFSQGNTTPVFQSALFPAGYLQGNLGYQVFRRWELGGGITYYSLGMRNRFVPEGQAGNSFGTISLQTDYPFMPHLYLRYTLSEETRRFPALSISLGMLYARERERWAIGEGAPVVENIRPDGQIFYSRFESVIEPHTFLAVDARLDMQMLNQADHRLFAVFHLIKGLNPVMTTQHAYSVGSPTLDQQSTQVLRGDYVGVGIAWRYRVWKKETN